jgi:hypothetical protein
MRKEHGVAAAKLAEAEEALLSYHPPPAPPVVLKPAVKPAAPQPTAAEQAAAEAAAAASAVKVKAGFVETESVRCSSRSSSQPFLATKGRHSEPAVH